MKTQCPPKKPRHPLYRFVRCLGIAYVVMCVLAAAFYPHLLYHPERRESGTTPAISGVAHEEFWLEAPDGVRLNGWRVSASGEGERRGTLLVFHGNAGNLGTASHRLAIYSRLGCDVFMVDYHGFGKSGGEPSENALYSDADALWNYVTGDLGVDPGDIVIMGYSLGGAVASWLAEQHPDAAGLILESTFTRLSDVASDFFPFLPCRLIVGNAYNTEDRLSSMKMPLLVIHGEGDELVAFTYGRRLYALYAGEKTFLRIGNDHNVGFLAAGDSYSNGVQEFLTGKAWQVGVH